MFKSVCSEKYDSCLSSIVISRHVCVGLMFLLIIYAMFSLIHEQILYYVGNEVIIIITIIITN